MGVPQCGGDGANSTIGCGWCTTESTTGASTTTQTTPPSTTTWPIPDTFNISFADTDTRSGILGGEVTWNYPVHPDTAYFKVYFAENEDNAVNYVIWDKVTSSDKTPVGTNLLSVWWES